MPVSTTNLSTNDSISNESLLEIQRQVDNTYKNLLDNFDPAVKQLILSGKNLFKSFLTLNDASKVYIDNLNKVASTGLQSKGETNKISTSITQICEAWKEVHKDHEEIIAFFGTQVLAPTETNLEHDAKALTEQWKGFQRGQKTIEKRIHGNRKKGIPVKGITEELLKLKTDGLTKAANEEKKRYLFMLERHVAVVTLYIKLHRQALHLFEENVEKWRDMCTNPEILAGRILTFIDDLPMDETPYGTGTKNFNNDVEVHRESNGATDDRSESDLSGSTKKSSRNPSPVPHHEPIETQPELKLLRFQPLPESMKPLMESTLSDEHVEASPLYSVPNPTFVEKQVQTQILLEASSQTDIIPQSEPHHSNGSEYAPDARPVAVFQPPPPPPVPPVEHIRPILKAAPAAPAAPATTVPAPFRYTPPAPVYQVQASPAPVLGALPAPLAPPLVVAAREPWEKPQSFSEHYVEASYPYNANSPNQVAFREGDYIKVIQDGNLGWKYGENMRTKERGWFPASFVKAGKEKTTPSSSNSLQPISEQKSPIPEQPRHSPDPPKLKGLIKFEPKPQQIYVSNKTSPHISWKPPPKPSPPLPPPPPPVVEPIPIEKLMVPSTIMVTEKTRPELHTTNFDTIPRDNPYSAVKLRKVVRAEDGVPKKYV